MTTEPQHLLADCRRVGDILARVGDKWTILLLMVIGDRRHQTAAANGYQDSVEELGGLQAAAAQGKVMEANMALTKSFKDLVQRRVAKEPDFAEALLREGIDTMLTGDIETGKSILRDYIKATVGFEKLAEATDTSLIRMFSPRGNPQARNLFGVIGYYKNMQVSNCTLRLSRADLSCDPSHTRKLLMVRGNYQNYLHKDLSNGMLTLKPWRTRRVKSHLPRHQNCAPNLNGDKWTR